MATSTPTVSIPLLAMAFLWICCWPAWPFSNAMNYMKQSDDNNDQCNITFDHCIRSPGPNTMGKRTRPIGKLAPAVPREKMPPTDYLRSRCYCDPQCRKFGDCCPDLVTDELNAIEQQFSTRTRWTRQKDNPSALVWECQRLPLEDSQYTHIYVIGSCPTKYPLNGLHKKCKRSIAKDDYDYKLDIPVISARTNLIYANIFCAMCHNDNKVHNWKINTVCPYNAQNCTKNRDLWKYLPGERRWDYDNKGIVVYDITFRDTNPALKRYYYEMLEAHKCRQDVVDACPPSWTGTRERQLCAAYTYYIKLPNNAVVYKNEHCAMCHQKSAQKEQFECPAMFLGMGIVLEIPMAPLYYIVRPGWGKPKCGTGSMSRCKRGEVCDRKTKACRATTCGRRYKMDDNGKCVKRTKRSP